MYYFDDGLTFTSKIKALEHKKKTGLDVKIYYYDDVYDKVNWKIEPEHTLDYYYKEQAQRIRDNYEYVVLCYSGGHDSTNILETFYYNNIKLDKIVTIGALKQDSRSHVDENHNGELYANVFPYIEELGLQSITQVVDYTEYFNDVNNFSIVQYGSEWYDYTGAWYSPHHWFWRDIHKFIIPPSMSDKKAALIFGIDKPSLYRNHLGNLGFRFKDTSIATYGNVLTNGNCDRIHFYWDPTFPEILVKQLHLLNKFYANHENRIPGKMMYDKSALTNQMTDTVAYNLRKPLKFQSPKSPTPVFSLRDKYLFDKTDSDVYKLFASGVKSINSKVGLDIKPILSKFYPIT